MRLEALETRVDEFDERNLVLQGVLGLLSAAERLDRVLEREAPETAPSSNAVVHDEDRLLVEFVLGLVSFRETLGDIVTDAAVQYRDGASPPDDRASVGGDLFRAVLR